MGFSIGGIQIKTPDSIQIGSGGDLVLNRGILGSSGGDHIPAQNAAGDQLAQVVIQYNNLKANNQNTVNNVQQLVTAVNSAVSQFASVVNQANTSRARAGLAEIQRLAGQVIGSMTTTTGAVFTPQGTVIGQGGGILSGVDNSTLLLGAGALYLLMKK